MPAWCSTADVEARVAGNPPVALLQEMADRATSLLYVLTGRSMSTERSVIVDFQIDRRGYVKLTAWAPVREITTATIDGLEVSHALSPGGTYAVFSSAYAYQFVRLTIEVGQNPPKSGRDAAAALAAEMIREDPRYATTGPGDTKPSDARPAGRITSIVRQGVTYTFADPAALAEKNLTGVYEVDLFLRAVNPNGMRHQPKVVSL